MVSEVGVGREQRRVLEKSACQAEEFSDSKWMQGKNVFLKGGRYSG